MRWNSNDLEYQKKLGSGSFGEVYRASWKKTPVAVKILSSYLEDKQVKISDFGLSCFQYDPIQYYKRSREPGSRGHQRRSLQYECGHYV